MFSGKSNAFIFLPASLPSATLLQCWAYDRCPRMFAESIRKLLGRTHFSIIELPFYLFIYFFICFSWNNVGIACRLYRKSCVALQVPYDFSSSYLTSLISDDFSFHLEGFLQCVNFLSALSLGIRCLLWNILPPLYLCESACPC